MDTIRRSRSTSDIPSVGVTAASFSIPPLPRPPANSINNTHHFPQNDPPAPVETQPYNPQGRIRRFMAFLGYGSPTLRARRALVSLYTSLILYAIQFVVVIAILVVAAKSRSPTNPSLNEWRACSKPLGIWGALWVVRTCFSAALAYWGWRRGPRTGRSDHNGPGERRPLSPRDIEASRPPITHTGTSQGFSNILADPSPSPAPESRWFARLSVLSSLCTLSWFLTAHIFEYSSLKTCRHSSPHLFWLVFGILCISYFMILEVAILAFIAFIIAPLLVLFWNLILFILGRHPLQNPDIRPEIGKLPKALVDRIPLVVYIPPPPEGEESPKNETGITPPPPVYPPKSPAGAPLRPKRRFRFLGPKGKTTHPTEKRIEQGNGTWESNWEQSEYPFVRLEGNRAVCSICLMDFEEPPRVKPDGQTGPAAPREQRQHPPVTFTSKPSKHVKKVPINKVEDPETSRLHLADAGEGSQPLRLLPCGHAFHKTCIDPWLTDISGRCAVCQRAVELFLGQKEARQSSRWPWRR